MQYSDFTRAGIDRLGIDEWYKNHGLTWEEGIRDQTEMGVDNWRQALAGGEVRFAEYWKEVQFKRSMARAVAKHAREVRQQQQQNGISPAFVDPESKDDLDTVE